MAKKRRRPQKKSTIPGWVIWLGVIIIVVGYFIVQPNSTTNELAISTPTTSPSPTPSVVPTATITVAKKTPLYTYNIINTYPHDPDAFTQGLIVENGIFYEGTGLYGRSTLRKVELEGGKVLQAFSLKPQFFGEGITVFNGRVIQLTWKAKVGFVYDKNSFNFQTQFTYPTEGWGITHDGTRLIMSDGTANLYFWDSETFTETGRVEVQNNGLPIVNLNELEYVKGEVYANIWQTNRIARINPKTGQVIGWIVLDGLLTAEDMSRPVDVLNGIAYDAQNDRLFVTGKLWPKIFEIELVPVR